MMGKIDLVAFNAPKEKIIWNSGTIIIANYDNETIAAILNEQKDKVGSTFFWDWNLGPADEELVLQLNETKGDIFHAGNRLHTCNFLVLYHHINPCWMLSATAPANISSVSWFHTFRASLIRNSVIDHLNGIQREFRLPTYSALDFGYRSLKAGFVAKYESRFIKNDTDNECVSDCLEDFIFTRKHFTKGWVRWAAYRAFVTKAYSLSIIVNGYLRSRNVEKVKNTNFLYPAAVPIPVHNDQTVSAVIITLGRYAYIETVINQLLVQTIPLKEIIVVDGNPETERDYQWQKKLQSHEKVKIFYSDITGQCTQRNIGIEQATGKYILFMDDDMDKIPVDHIEKHLFTINYFDAQVSCGMPDEVGIIPAKRQENTYFIGDYFPTNDVLAEKKYVLSAGLFDPNFDKGQCADHDIGMRIYLDGALMIANPALKTLHLRAGAGGLRTHGNRKITYGSSRRNILHKRLLHMTEIYLGMKYFPIEEVKEKVLINSVSTFSIHGGILKKVAKMIFAGFTFGKTKRELKTRFDNARKLLIK